VNCLGVFQFLPERDVLFPSVYRLSVMFVRPTQSIEIFGNISTAFGTIEKHSLRLRLCLFAMSWLVKITVQKRHMTL